MIGDVRVYLKPRQIFEKFLVEEKRTRLDEIGNSRVEFVASGELFGVISTVEPHEVEKWHGLKHTVTHKIVQHLGASRAQVGDKLIKADKIFFVEAVDDISGLGQFFVYFVSERADVK